MVSFLTTGAVINKAWGPAPPHPLLFSLPSFFHLFNPCSAGVELLALPVLGKCVELGLQPLYELPPAREPSDAQFCQRVFISLGGIESEVVESEDRHIPISQVIVNSCYTLHSLKWY